MIRLFGLGDVLLLRDLQRKSETVNSESALLGEYPSLRLALMGYVFPLGSGACTCVLDPAGQSTCERGFVQVRMRPGCPEWDLIYVAPALDQAEGSFSIWRRLLDGLSGIASERGVQRMYARPLHDEVREEVLRSAGFNVYARERVFRCSSLRVKGRRCDGTWRPRRDDDWGEMRRLYRSATPHLVRQAEGGDMRWYDEALPGQLGVRSREEYVLEDGRHLAAYLGLTGGRRGYWLHLLLAESKIGHAAEVVGSGLDLLAGRAERPIYWGVRDYQHWLVEVLQGRGFEPVADRSLMVKHTTVKVKVPKLKLIPGLENGVNAATSVSPGVKSGSRLGQ